MRAAYLDCFSGISGNMLLGAVIDAGAGARKIREMAGRVVGGFRLSARRDKRGHIGGVHVKVGFSKKGQPHRRLSHISRMIEKSGLPGPVRERSIMVFQNLARAEAKVHRIEPEQVHFHEVGAVDAIVDVVGSVAGLHLLGVQTIACSPLPVGGGEVECAHGTLPLPAPAVMELLKGAPIKGVEAGPELVTPTGAALAATLSSAFGPIPAMVVEKVGTGLGDRELEHRPNIMRIMIGEVMAAGDVVIQLEAAIDDMRAESFDFLMERLYLAGALEVLLVPAQMKKNRPGTLVRVLAEPGRREAVAEALFNHSTTLGVRWCEVSRAVLPRKSVVVRTPYGNVGVKFGRRPDRSQRAHIEYDDLRAAAAKSGVTLETVEASVLEALRRGKTGKG